jgi:hypothetical protein
METANQVSPVRAATMTAVMGRRMKMSALTGRRTKMRKFACKVRRLPRTAPRSPRLRDISARQKLIPTFKCHVKEETFKGHKKEERFKSHIKEERFKSHIKEERLQIMDQTYQLTIHILPRNRHHLKRNRVRYHPPTMALL